MFEKAACNSSLPAAADQDGRPADEFHEAAPRLERFYSAKSELARSQEDLRVHGDVRASSAAMLYITCHALPLQSVLQACMRQWCALRDSDRLLRVCVQPWLGVIGAGLLQVELARQDGVAGSPAGVQVTGDGAPAPRPVPRGLERETSIPPVASEDPDSPNNTYERVGISKPEYRHAVHVRT